MQINNGKFLFKMSIELSQGQHDYQTKNRMQHVYQKFQKAHQNMSSFQEMLTKFSTHKKQIKNKEPQVKAFTLSHPVLKTEAKAISLVLSDNWKYSGEVFEQKFHGFGNLMLNQECIYIGQFKNGRMHGSGKLNYNQVFEQIINLQVQWKKYEGQFKEGHVQGFGNLYLSGGVVITGYWNRGKPLYFTRVQQNIIQI